ncbi:DNA ligase 1 isoform X1 [Parasteatoda tepidariorum]|uniref:DNA ligase 1 isoform X1 n=1 Tax=Parasteatoda tepidariorum TaxID=114398 RepID=UPI001C719B99|nr:DNA ligase 1 isoform X1 [Parasteatoda tepidariorum]
MIVLKCLRNPYCRFSNRLISLCSPTNLMTVVNSPLKVKLLRNQRNLMVIMKSSAADCSNSSKKQNGFELTENDSPIKQGKKRKTRLIDSDEESNQSQNGVSNTVKNESEKMEVDDSQEVGESLQSNNSSTKLIGKQLLSSEDSLQNVKESSSKKIKLEGNSPGKTNVLSNLSDSRVNSQSPSSSILCNRNSKLPPPPKRKTARKSMKASNAIETSFEEDSTKQFPSIETYEEEVVKKDSSTKDENKTSKIKSDDIEESKEESSEKITSSKKPQAIHPFFAKKESPVKSKNVSESEKEEEKNSSSDGESESKKNNKNPDDSEKVDESSNEKAKKKTVNSSSSGVHYDPSKSKYHPIEDACWKRNEKVPYLALAKTLEFIENTSARLKIVEILANYFRSVIVLTPDDLLQSVYLCLNRIAPEYEGIELGVGDMVLMKAVAQATGRTLDKIRAEVKEKGDLGLVAESSRGNQKVMFAPPKLTVASVFSKFKEIAKMSGNAAMAKKTDKIQTLFVACRDCEAKYIIRSLSGKLRIGLAEQSVLAALGRAVVLTPPGQTYPPDKIDTSSGMSSEKFKKLQDEKTLILKTTYCECPNYDLMIPVLLKEGIDRLSEHCQLSPGCPLKPMLAHPTTGIDEVLQRFVNNDFTCEFKYDGERAQIHRTDKGEVKIFSRNQEDNTSKYPDIIARISKALKDTTKSFILDTEAVAWDHEMKQILPFQILSTRKKKDAAKSEIVVQVCVMAFDLLYLNGESLVKKPLKERRELLHSSFDEVPNEFMFVTYKDGNSAETMQEFLDESIKGNCEGLMVKALKVDASYEIAKRSHNWLKLKKDYLNGVGDTLDLVVIGGYHGKGKRTGTYGGFLLACYDNDNEEFQSICKLGTGFKEDELEAHTKFLKNHVISAPKSYYRFDHSLEPDEWFEPEQIWEVKCADLSISPIHKAAIGIVDPEKGISLRFPRFLKIRDDKKVEEATNSSQIAEMYRRQDQVQNMKAKPKNEENYY